MPAAKAKPKISQKWRKLFKLIPGYDPVKTAARGDWFDEDAAEESVAFFHECIQHVEGAVAGKPFILEPWEQAIIGCLFGWKSSTGYRRYREVLIYVPRKNGKMLALDTPLPTPTGWTTMGEVEVGDVLFDEAGKQCRVHAVHQIDLQPESYRIEFSNGEIARACADHLWVTTARVDATGVGVGARQKELFSGVPRGTSKPLATRIRSTREIFETQHYGVGLENNHSLMMPGPIDCGDAELPIDPYILGAWIGDGDSDCGRISVGKNDLEMFENLQDSGAKLGKVRIDRRSGVRRATILGISSRLRSIGLIGRKHIPETYLRASICQRISLLQGLMDTDGTVNANGRQLEFCTICEDLANDMLELLASLGIKAKCLKRQPTISGVKRGKLAYRIIFSVFGDVVPCFRLHRKAVRLRSTKDSKRMPRCRSVQITSVTPIKPVPMRCITVDSPSGQYLFGRTMLPTHNTPIAAGICNKVLFTDNEPGAQVYSVAAEREQASLLYRHARGMVEREPMLLDRAKVYAGQGHRSIVLKSDPASSYRVLSADADSKHGFNPHCVVADELHAMRGRELIDTLTTGFASANRLQPLMIYITTADYMGESICNEKYEYACRVRDGATDDPQFLPVIYEAGPDDDWKDPKVWAKANPNLGVSVSREYLERECKKAQEIPALENSFRRLHLNQRTEQDVRWISLDTWDRCNGALGSLDGRPCFAGLDLSSTSDLIALVLLFRHESEPWDVLPFFWCTQAMAEQRERKAATPYLRWAHRNLIEITEGNATDYGLIRRRVNEVAAQYRITELAIDRLFQGHQLAQELGQDGLPVIDFGQGFMSMAAPCKQLTEMILNGRIRHAGHEVLRWNASNVGTETDSAGNIKFSKKKSGDKIDGIVALSMALGRAMLAQDTDLATEVMLI